MLFSLMLLYCYFGWPAKMVGGLFDTLLMRYIVCNLLWGRESKRGLHGSSNILC